MEAATIGEDEFSLRFMSLAVDLHFCYHMDNQCYKQYTLKKTLDTIKINRSIMVLFI